MPILEAIQQQSDPCLIEAARQDRDAFAALFRRHHDAIYRYCARRLPDRAAAEDITSQVFLKMVAHLNQFTGDEAAFRGWLYRIACNEIHSFFRRRGRQDKAYTALREAAATEQPDTTADCDDRDENDHRKAFLTEALAALKPDHQDIVTLRFLDGLNSDQIGAVLNLKPATVRSRLARALKTIKKRYQTRHGQPAEVFCGYE